MIKNINRNFIFILLQIFIIFEKRVELKFLQTLGYRIGGNSLTCDDIDIPILAKFDLLMIQRFLFYNCDGNVWRKLRDLNPDIIIFLYMSGTTTRTDHDGNDRMYVDTIARYNSAVGHSMGSLNGDHSEWFLLDSGNNRISYTGFGNNRYWLDIGVTDWEKYLLEGVDNDIISQEYKADGIFFDNCIVLPWQGGVQSQVKYTDEEYGEKANTFAKSMTDDLGLYKQYAMYNRGFVLQENGYNAWISLDELYEGEKTEYVPFQFDEGVFAVFWGPDSVQFYPETRWKREVDLLKNIKHSKALYISHCSLSPGQQGTDNNGKSVTFEDIFWYAMGSFHIGKNKNNNCYWQLNNDYNDPQWFIEYEKIDLGEVMDEYKVKAYSGNNIYYREFEKGYIYVNPTTSDVSNIELLEKCYILNHDNFENFDPEYERNITVIDLLKSHRAVFLVKKIPSTKDNNVTVIVLISSLSSILVLLVLVSIIVVLVILIVRSIKYIKKNRNKSEKYINVKSSLDDVSSKSEIEESVTSKSEDIFN